MDLVSTGCVASNGVVTLDCAPILIGNLLVWALTFAGIAALIFVIFGGFKFLTSGGDKEKVEGARKTITFSLIGLAVILSSFLIIRTLGQITGVNCVFPGTPGNWNFNVCGLPKITCDGNPPACNGTTAVCFSGTWSCGTQGTSDNQQNSGSGAAPASCSDSHPNGTCPDQKDCILFNGHYGCHND